MNDRRLYDLSYYAKQLQSEDMLVEAVGLEVNTKTDSKEVLHLEFNSQNVKPGTLFVCKGAHFKKEYLEDAIARGAIAYVAAEKFELSTEIPYLKVSDIRTAMPLLAEVYYNNPQKQLKIIAIGGTKGKTTTTYFIKTILDAYLEAQGKAPAGLISSIANFSGTVEEKASNTTSEALELQKILAGAVDAGLEYMVMEVSSQALKYHRTARIEFDLSVFLNIDEDHISDIEHPDFADYLASKAKMFEQTRDLVINSETEEADYLFEKAKNAERRFTFSVSSDVADYYALNIETIGLKNKFKMHSASAEADFVLAMTGKFNVENALAAIAATELMGVPIKYAQKVLSEIEVPGRMRIFSSADEKIIGVADYAHNRLSFGRLITEMKEAYPDYQVFSVVGAPGDKAYDRREELGTIAGRYSDFVYITMDDPGSESVAKISGEISEYVKKEGAPYLYIENREEAIRQAFADVSEKTIILVIGKGHETTMKIGTKNVPMKSDETVIQECLEEYSKF